MPFEPDIIVTSRDAPGVAMVGEVKLHLADRAGAEQQLKHFMHGMGCALGMIVTPSVLLLYRDKYRDQDESSIEFVGEFPLPASLLGTASSLRGRGPEQARAFEDAVQSWLENLAADVEHGELAEPLRTAMETHVLPALGGAEVRAARPRWQRTGT